MGGQPLTRDCTIVTNGSNLLRVYLDGIVVFSSNTMDLGYQYPLSAFLEVQTTDNTAMYFSVYRDYYATASDTVTVRDAPPGSTVAIVDQSGNFFARGQADNSGTATLQIGMYHMPLRAYIRVFLMGTMIGSTTGSVDIYEGDVYTVSLSLGTGQGQGETPAVPYTSNPSTSTIVNPNVGFGITLDQIAGVVFSIGTRSGTICMLGTCF
jgi:hypothetical protein